MWSSSGSRVGMTLVYYVWTPDPSFRSEGGLRSRLVSTCYSMAFCSSLTWCCVKSCMSYLLTVQRLSAVLSQYQKKYLPLNTEDGVWGNFGCVRLATAVMRRDYNVLCVSRDFIQNMGTLQQCVLFATVCMCYAGSSISSWWSTCLLAD